ncbi:hypothetical protein [Flavobacterium psychrophilum]|uniref:hypothetical protein n=1 Tax=Flavobacterium psychrophilum TaxID=96345 RepID=UPI001D09315B|nr:hypothetical protein [Flavobacterium psychrophilum]MCB6072427.1 hypothetical protein [Flavobacterium psychrophilum]MCB6109539.1 hypothetical protein [Flavobacterium psychrophilum]
MLTENLTLDNECSNPLSDAFPPTETLKTLIPPFMPVSFSIDEVIATSNSKLTRWV